MSKDLIDSPVIPDEVFKTIPNVLKKGCAPLESKRERDIYLLSQLTLFGAFFPNVSGIYRRKTYYPYIYTYIIGPPASGKSVMLNAKKGVSLIEKEYFINKGAINEGNEEPKKKYRKSLFISGNTSDSEFINKMNANDEVGIFFESESDTIADTLKQDWAGYSDKLRKANEHESFGKARVSDEVEIEIAHPKLTVCISGTTDQLSKMLPSPQNGLFSRFGFYGFAEERAFEYPGPTPGSINFDEHYKEIAEDLLNIYLHVNSNPVQIFLSHDQWDRLYNYFLEWDKYVKKSNIAGFASVIKRHGVMTFRFAQILTILRIGEGKLPLDKYIDCNEIDFQNAMSIIHTLMHHALQVFNLYSSDPKGILKPNLVDLLQLLPNGETITKEGIIEIWGNRFSERTAYNRINDLIEKGFIQRMKNDSYLIINPN